MAARTRVKNNIRSFTGYLVSRVAPRCVCAQIVSRIFSSDIPGLAVDISTLETPGKISGLESEIVYAELSQKVLNLLLQLDEWRWQWEQNYSNCTFELPARTDILGERRDSCIIFPTALHFTSHERAHEVIHYNAILTFLLKLKESLFGEVSINLSTPDVHSVHPDKRVLLRLSSALTRQIAAVEICRCVEYFLLNAPGSSAALFVMFALRVADLSFLPQSRESQWISKVCELISDTSGFEVLRRIIRSCPSDQIYRDDDRLSLKTEEEDWWGASSRALKRMELERSSYHV